MTFIQSQLQDFTIPCSAIRGLRKPKAKVMIRVSETYQGLAELLLSHLPLSSLSLFRSRFRGLTLLISNPHGLLLLLILNLLFDPLQLHFLNVLLADLLHLLRVLAAQLDQLQLRLSRVFRGIPAVYVVVGGEVLVVLLVVVVAVVVGVGIGIGIGGGGGGEGSKRWKKRFEGLGGR